MNKKTYTKPRLFRLTDRKQSHRVMYATLKLFKLGQSHPSLGAVFEARKKSETPS
jgi:hypothetical protein